MGNTPSSEHFGRQIIGMMDTWTIGADFGFIVLIILDPMLKAMRFVPMCIGGYSMVKFILLALICTT